MCFSLRFVLLRSYRRPRSTCDRGGHLKSAAATVGRAGRNIVTRSRGNATLLSGPKTPWMRVNLSSADVAIERVATRNPLQEKMVGAVRFELTTF